MEAAAAAAAAASAACLAAQSMQNQSPFGTRFRGGLQHDRWQALSQLSHSSRMSPSSAHKGRAARQRQLQSYGFTDL